MNRTEAKEIARSRLAEYLERITERKGGQYICPVCGSGTGANKTHAGKLNDDFTYHCFSCGFHGDIFSLAGKIENMRQLTAPLSVCRVLADIIHPIFNIVLLMDFELEPTETEALDLLQSLFDRLFHLNLAAHTEYCGQDIGTGEGTVDFCSCGHIHAHIDCPNSINGVHGSFTASRASRRSAVLELYGFRKPRRVVRYFRLLGISLFGERLAIPDARLYRAECQRRLDRRAC